MSRTYQAEEVTFKQLVSKYTDLIIPPFQRSYQWGSDEVDMLFEDIMQFDATNFKSNALPETHFMGAMVFCRVDADGQAKKGFSILDGQQRMVTLTLLQAALSSRLMKVAADAPGEMSQKLQLLQNAASFRHPLYKVAPIGKEAAVYILKPQSDDSEYYDFVMSAEWDAFDAACEKKLSSPKSKARKSKVLSSYSLIRAKIESGIVAPAVDHELDLFEVLVHVLKIVQECLSFVIIEALDESAAFRLFETLNSRGLELSSADLIKNKLFAICGASKSDHESVKQGWAGILDNEEIRKDPVAFFRTKWLSDHTYFRKKKAVAPASKGDDGEALEAAKSEFVRKDGLFEVYRDFLNQNEKAGFVPFVMKDLRDDADRLDGLICAETGHKECDRLLSDLNSLGARTCRPLLLAIYRAKDMETLRAVSELLASLTIRWTVAGKVTNVLETKYALLASNVSQMYASGKAKEVLFFVASELYQMKVPDDSHFLSDFAAWRPANVSRLARYALVKLNENISKVGEIASGSDKVHVEHLFPKSPSAEAFVESGITAEEEKEADYASLIGNLTLLDAKINMCIKNDPFSRKIFKYAEDGKLTIADSAFAINVSLKSKVKWTRDDIAARSNLFAGLAVGIWKWEKPVKAS